MDDRAEIAMSTTIYEGLSNHLKWFLMMYKLAQWQDGFIMHIVVPSYRLAQVEYDFSPYLQEYHPSWY